MRTRHPTRSPGRLLGRSRRGPGVRAVGTAVLAVWLASCALPVREVGRAPEGEVRPVETAMSRMERARREEARHERLDAEESARSGAAAQPAGAAAGPAGRVETPSAEASRTGTASTKRFHLAGCPDLEAAPPSDRVLFVSFWDAVDADYAPCPRCKPGH